MKNKWKNNFQQTWVDQSFDYSVKLKKILVIINLNRVLTYLLRHALYTIE